MAELASNRNDTLFCSILRLSSDSWTDIISHLHENDLQKLLRIGNVELCSRLRLAARHLRFKWFGPQFLDFTQVLDHASQFRNATSLSIRTAHKEILHWKPVNWSLLPRHLIRLELQFFGSILEFFTISQVKTLLPVLRALVVREARPKCWSKDLKRLPISFDGLPDSLLELRIIGPSRTANLPSAQLELLPPHLETLELRFEMNVIPMGPSLCAFRLQNLPKSLTSLAIRPHSDTKWDISISDLPSTLKTLEIEDSHISHTTDYVGPSRFRPTTLVTLEDIATHLPRLDTLIIKDLVLTPKEVATLIPPHITHLDVIVRSHPSDQDLNTISERILDSLQSFGGSGALLEQIISGQPRSLKVLTVGASSTSTPIGNRRNRPTPELVTVSPTQGFPHSITKLTIGNIFPSMTLPNGLTSLTVEVAFLPQTADVMRPYLFPSTLKVLNCPMSRNLPHEIAVALPDSLQFLGARLSEKTLCALFELMSTTPRLPNLAKIQNYQESTIASLIHLPSQVRKLFLTDVDASATEATNAAALKALSSSMLTNLRISIKKSQHSGLSADIINLLKHLPHSLTSLSVTAECQLYQHWPITWPPRLRFLAWDCTAIETVESRPPSTQQRPVLMLPPLLGFFIYYGDNEPPSRCLPPYLSAYQRLGKTRPDERAYFDAVPRPPSDVILNPGGF